MIPNTPTAGLHEVRAVFDDELDVDFSGGEDPDGMISDSTSSVFLRDIFPNPWNPHKMTSTEMDDLIDSVRQDGQWRPLLVVEMDVPDEETLEPPARYRIVDGFHLFQALSALHQEGMSDSCKVLVLGRNSEIPVWKQQLIGQTINHGLRGSIEDPEKNSKLVNKLLQHANETVLGKRFGVGREGIRAMATVAPSGIMRKPTSPAGITPIGGTVKSTPYAERKAYITALSFDEPDRQKRFDDLMDKLAPTYVDPDQYKGRRGQMRVDALMAMLEFLAEEE